MYQACRDYQQAGKNCYIVFSKLYQRACYILFLQILFHSEQEIKDNPIIYSHNNDSKLEEFLPAIHIFDSYVEKRRVKVFKKAFYPDFLQVP
jgi:hypothetical protein